jgi:hypothetical protein
MTTGPNDDDVEAAAGTWRRGGALREILLDHTLGDHGNPTRALFSLGSL